MGTNQSDWMWAWPKCAMWHLHLGMYLRFSHVTGLWCGEGDFAFAGCCSCQQMFCRYGPASFVPLWHVFRLLSHCAWMDAVSHQARRHYLMSRCALLDARSHQARKHQRKYATEPLCSDGCRESSGSKALCIELLCSDGCC